VALLTALAGRVFSKITNVQLLVAVVASLVVRNRAQHVQQIAISRRVECAQHIFEKIASHPLHHKLCYAQQQYVLDTYGENFALSTCQKKEGYEIGVFAWMRKKLQADCEQLTPQEFLNRHGYPAFRKPWSVSKDKLLTAVNKQTTLEGFLSEFGAGGVGDVVSVKGHLGNLIVRHLICKLEAYLQTDNGRADERPILFLLRTDKSLMRLELLKYEILQELKIPTSRECCDEHYDAIQEDLCRLKEAFLLLKACVTKRVITSNRLFQRCINVFGYWIPKKENGWMRLLSMRHSMN